MVPCGWEIDNPTACVFYSTGDRSSSFTETACGTKVGSSVTRRNLFRLMKVLMSQDFWHSESQKCTYGYREMYV
ncbi:hypothetical protein [Microcoleus sp.]|uniref:hypothetical protein n=1 Tax=Microcoleus sp. TaxID=44472 RepID=UPI0035935341